MKHKKRLQRWWLSLVTKKTLYEPGRSYYPEELEHTKGSAEAEQSEAAHIRPHPIAHQIVANDDKLIYLDAAGRITGTDRNEIVVMHPVAHKKHVRWNEAPDKTDDAIIETYLREHKIKDYSEREAREVWALYKQLTDNTPLKDATRDDGREIVKHYKDKGLKRETIKKKIMWVRAAVNMAIDEGKLRFNPFSNIIPEPDEDEEEEKYEPLDEADVRLIKRNLHKLSEQDQLLIRLLASTGMRLSEAYQFKTEKIERGCRYVIIGKKTPQSKRRVPFPVDLLPYLPSRIEGRLFSGSPAAASKRLNRFLDDIGITEPLKVVHSLRHRAQDRLRAADCREEYRWALLGHEKKTVAAGYGKGFPVLKLKRWIDQIGF